MTETRQNHSTPALAMQKATLLKQARLLIPRLERLPPDSSWARRASGYRGTLLRLVEILEPTKESLNSQEGENIERANLVVLQGAIDQGYLILNAAARESIS